MHRSAIKAPCVGLQQSLPVGPTYSPVGHFAFHLVDIEINSHSTQMDHKMRKKTRLGRAQSTDQIIYVIKDYLQWWEEIKG